MGRPIPEIAEAALDATAMTPLLHAAATAELGASVVIRAVEVERFDRRLVRYTMHVEAPEGPRILRVVGKVYEDVRLGQKGYDGWQRLWKSGFASEEPARIRIPRPYAYHPDLRLLLMEDVPGQPLKRLVRKGRAGPEHMTLLASAMAKLHGHPLVLGPPCGVDEHLAMRCNGLHEALAAAFPELADVVRHLVDEARAAEERFGRGAFTLAHGDFHLGQVQVEGEDAWLLDLDPLHHGDPAYDVAMALFALEQMAHKSGIAPRVPSLREAFVTGYFALRSWDVARRIPLQAALIHLKRACKRFRWQDEEGWRETAANQVRRSAACLGVLDGLVPPRSVADVIALDERCRRF